jgi:hypothetical protein
MHCVCHGWLNCIWGWLKSTQGLLIWCQCEPP